MVEVHVVVEPLYTSVMLATVFQSLVDWLDILYSANTAYEALSRGHDGVIAYQDAYREPSFSNLRVGGVSAVVLAVDHRHNGRIHVSYTLLQLIVENDLQVTVP